MKVLGIDSSSMVAGIALVTDEIVTAEYNINYKKTHSQTLMPMLEDICRMTEIDLSEIDAIAVSSGPGSFTGLRIGSATAKGIGLALQIPLIHIPTLEALAYNMWNSDKYICPIMDARRNQVYTAVYNFDKAGNIVNQLEQCAMAIEELIVKLKDLNKEIIFLGDGVPVFKEYIEENAEFHFQFAPAHLNRQRGAAVATLGTKYLKEGKTETALSHVPDYLRLSQAERERQEKENGSN